MSGTLRPSATGVVVAALIAGAAAFSRCGGAGPEPAAPPPATVAATERQTPATPSTASAAAERAADAGRPSQPDGAAPPTRTERKRYVVAAIGDSLTDANSNGGKYLDVLRQRCPQSRFDNFGRGGDMVNQMRRRFFRDVLPGWSHTHLLVFGGVNDLYSDLTAGRTPQKVGKDLTAMYAAARERGAKVVALTVAPWGGFTRYFNPSRAESTRVLNAWIAEQRSLGQVDYVVDAYTLLACGDRLCPELAAPFKDGLHFGPAGHEKLGQALFEQVFSDCR